MSFSKKFINELWVVKYIYRIDKCEGVPYIVEKLPKEDIRPKADGSGFVQLNQGHIVQEFSKEEILLVT